MTQQHLIFLGCDATWQTDVQACPTNVFKIHDSIRQGQVSENVFQSSFYFEGLKGSIGAPTGFGIGRIARTVFKQASICVNEHVEDFRHDPERMQAYLQGLTINFIGASRGDVAARLVMGMIYKGGLLDFEKIRQLEETDILSDNIIDRYTLAHLLFYENSYKPSRQEAQDFRQQRGFIPVPQFNLARIDPVSALVHSKLAFHDYELNRNVNNVFQAFALHEARKGLYHGTEVYGSPNNATNFTTQYFAGDHMAITGGVAKTEALADFAGLEVINWQRGIMPVVYDEDKVQGHFYPDIHCCPDYAFYDGEKLWSKFIRTATETIAKIGWREPPPAEQVHWSTQLRWLHHPDPYFTIREDYDLPFTSYYEDLKPTALS